MRSTSNVSVGAAVAQRVARPTWKYFRALHPRCPVVSSQPVSPAFSLISLIPAHMISSISVDDALGQLTEPTVSWQYLVSQLTGSRFLKQALAEANYRTTHDLSAVSSGDLALGQLNHTILPNWPDSQN